MGTSQPAPTQQTLLGGMSIRAGLRALTFVAVAGLLLAGCGQNELGRYTGYQADKWVVNDPKRIRNQIVKSENYWIQKEVVPEEQFPGPTPDDLKPPEDDYILGAGDLIQVTVFELMQPGMPYRLDQRISQSGQITFPYLGAVKCSGLSPRGLEEKLSDLLEPDYLVDPQISVYVAEFRNLQVSILNGVYRAGIYPMNKQDMTLLELVAYAGGVLQLVEDYGYVIREYSPEEADMMLLQAGVGTEEGAAPAEGAAPGEEKKPADEKKPAEKAPADAKKPAGKAPADAKKPAEKAPADAAKPAEKAPADAAKPAEKAPADATKPAEKAPAKVEPKAGSGAAAPAPSSSSAAGSDPPAAAKKPDESAAKEARAVLEKMAEGEMPAVGKIEAAEAGSPAAKPQAAAAKTPAVEAKPADPKLTAAALAQDEEELGHWIWSDGKWVEVKPKAKPATAGKPAPAGKPAAAGKTAVAVKPVEAVKPAEAGKTAVAVVPTEEPAPPAVATEPVKVAEVEKPPATPVADDARLALANKLRRLGVVQGSGQLKRIIRFDVRALQAGDPTQNVVLRDGDIVTIPSPPVGDFYMAGEVARPGVYSLTGRKITLLQAVAAAGGLTAVAVPWRTELVRRISETEEEIIYVDLGKVSRGEAPDFYVQPEDQIRVGTDQGAIYNAVLRNAFRATYGLGAVYDMNFADFYPWSSVVRPLLD